MADDALTKAAVEAALELLDSGERILLASLNSWRKALRAERGAWKGEPLKAAKTLLVLAEELFPEFLADNDVALVREKAQLAKALVDAGVVLETPVMPPNPDWH